MKLAGRSIVITGASQGLGRAIAQACVAEGADVLLCARSTTALQRTCAELEDQATSGQRVVAGTGDVSRPDDVRRLLDIALHELPPLDGLVNNAGIYGPKGRVEDVDWHEWVQTIEINLLGAALMCRELVGGFRSRGYGKIVNVSGGGATAPMPNFSAYAASKAALVRFSETLAEETRGSGIDVNALAPGALNTRMLDEVLEAGPAKVGQGAYDRALLQKADGGASLERAAALCVFLLSRDSDGITGRLISAVWDPWELLPQRAGHWKETDVYTLRRIVPSDRGLDWG
jgi:NAD(P)-dependent dehydrogenase (short-subunit alcohol dehydrogenase family)